MAAENLERSIILIFGNEGGYVNNPHDSGGPTKFGITQKTLAAWRKQAVTEDDVKALTIEEATKILRSEYWAPIRGDDLPAGVDHATFDFSVNSDPPEAVKCLQRVVGTDVDGLVGVQTLTAVNACQPIATIDQLCDRRLKFLRGLKKYRYFGKGWTTRVQRVRAEAKSMVKATPVATNRHPDEFAAANPKDTKLTVTPHGLTGIGGGLAAAGAACTTVADKIEPYSYMLPILGWVFAALTIAAAGIGIYLALRKSSEGSA